MTRDDDDDDNGRHGDDEDSKCDEQREADCPWDGDAEDRSSVEDEEEEADDKVGERDHAYMKYLLLNMQYIVMPIGV